MTVMVMMMVMRLMKIIILTMIMFIVMTTSMVMIMRLGRRIPQLDSGHLQMRSCAQSMDQSGW